MKMKSSIRVVLGKKAVILGCCALAFAGLNACLVWGGCQGGECFFTLDKLVGEMKVAAATSASIGVAGVVLGLLLIHAKAGSKAGPSQQRLP
jgi:hypothetical protein